MHTNYNGHSRKSGIYQIRNLNNGKVYIGSAKCFKVRFTQHIKSLRKGTHHNKHLQGAFNLEGTDVFIFEVLEVVEGEQADRLLVEQKHINFYLEKWELCYNFNKQAKASTRTCFSKSPEETRKKLSIAQRLLWQDPLERKKRIEGADGTRREKISKASKKAYENMSKFKREELSEQRKTNTKKLWQDPKHRTKVLKKMKCAGATTSLKQKVKYKKDPLYRKALLERLAKANLCKKYKTYFFLNEEGNLIEVTNLNKWCNIHGLSYGCMKAVASGKQKSHKGWKKASTLPLNDQSYKSPSASSPW